MAKAPRATLPVLLWFRRDLRLGDNPALMSAAASGRPVIPLFILEADGGSGGRPRGAASRWWLDKSLKALVETLEAKGSRLVLRSGDPARILPELASETGAEIVVWNRVYEPAALERDGALAKALNAAGVATGSFNASLLFEPDAIRTKSGGAYGVFTPFWRAARPQIGPIALQAPPTRLPAPKTWPASEEIAAWRLHPTAPDWSQGFDIWTPGEAGAKARLDRLLGESFGDYPVARDRPGLEGSSRLSPHLAWGEIGARQIYCAVEGLSASHPESGAAADKFLSELAWREFNYAVLASHPGLAEVNVKGAFDALPWRTDAKGFRAWTRGLTGYPIVDAGMRQLWTEGWMHNRVRLITASFLVKHLLIDWRKGEHWFWDTLVDGDPANNPSNWQWVAGSGMDASPFFRIFNPVIQGEKFDADGAYVRRWIPEIGKLPDRRLHAPWTATADEFMAADLELGRDYPRPIVDHAAARARALEALRSVRSTTGAEA